MHEAKYLIQIIKYLLNSEKAPDKIPTPPKAVDWEQLIKIAERHSLGSLLYHVVPKLQEELRPQEDLLNHMRKRAMSAAVTDIKQRAEKQELVQQFEKHQLYCMPVKGCDTKEYYPKTEWRTMGDLDILYKAEQHNEVKALLLELGYSDFESGLKHDHYSKPPFIAVEMHRGLVAANTMAEDYYEDVWEKAVPRDGYEYIYQMRPEELYIYTMIHLLEHFQNGGVGIRFIMDIYVLSKQGNINREYVLKVFQNLGISKFAYYIEQLAEKWFGKDAMPLDEETNAILEELGDFIIQNGTYGSSSHAQNVAVEREGRIGYMKRMAFPNYNSMKTLYPWLVGKAYLLPFAWGIRIVRTILFRKDSIQVGMNTLKYGDSEQGKELLEFYKRCGL